MVLAQTFQVYEDKSHTYPYTYLYIHTPSLSLFLPFFLYICLCSFLPREHLNIFICRHILFTDLSWAGGAARVTISQICCWTHEELHTTPKQRLHQSVAPHLHIFSEVIVAQEIGQRQRVRTRETERARMQRQSIWGLRLI